MTENEKSELWKNIESIIKAVEDEINTLINDNPEYRMFGFHRKEYDPSLKEIIFEEYETQNNCLKEMCYEDPTDQLLDQHKIGACLCASFIKHKVFAFKLYNGLPEEIILSNYRVAFEVSLLVVSMFLVVAYKDSKDEKHKDLLDKIKMNWKDKCVCMRLPQTTESFKDSYSDGRIKTLAINDIFGKHVDLLLYADMLYWIEYFNRQLLEDTVEPQIDLSWRNEDS